MLFPPSPNSHEWLCRFIEKQEEEGPQVLLEVVALLVEDLHFLHNLPDSQDIHLEAQPGSYEADLQVGDSNHHRLVDILHNRHIQAVVGSRHQVEVGNRLVLGDNHRNSHVEDSLAVGLVDRARSQVVAARNSGIRLVVRDIHLDSPKVGARYQVGRLEVHLETVTADCVEMVIRQGVGGERVHHCGKGAVGKGQEMV